MVWEVLNSRKHWITWSPIENVSYWHIFPGLQWPPNLHGQDPPLLDIRPKLKGSSKGLYHPCEGRPCFSWSWIPLSSHWHGKDEGCGHSNIFYMHGFSSPFASDLLWSWFSWLKWNMNTLLDLFVLLFLVAWIFHFLVNLKVEDTDVLCWTVCFWVLYYMPEYFPCFLLPDLEVMKLKE